MNRRRFLSLLVRGAAAIHCAPWLRFLPLPASVKDPLIDEINAITLEAIYPAAITDQFFKATSFVDFLRSGRTTETGHADMVPPYVFNDESSEWEWTDEERT